ncbi:MAG: hypothetical protein AAFX56_06965 [Pseudomonadota bacterium]
MRTAKGKGLFSLLLCLMAAPALVQASAVRHMNLDALVENSGAIFRGTVTGIESGSVTVGGKEMPTTTYLFKVGEMFKGEPTAVRNGEQFLAITMIGSGKHKAASGPIVRFDMLRDIPRLETGSEYLLFTTVESSAGLSVTVGLAQGCFDILGGMALNRAGNAGLFQGMQSAAPSEGPIAYRDLAARIRTSLTSQ